MNNKIILKDGKHLIGVSNIVVSEVDDTIFINSSSFVEDSIPGSLTFYSGEGSCSLKGTGNRCLWDFDTDTLKVTNLNSDHFNSLILKSNCIETSILTAENATLDLILGKEINANGVHAKSMSTDTFEISNYSNIEKCLIKKWIGFKSKITEDSSPFKISLAISPHTNKEILLFTSNEYENTEKYRLIGLEENRIYLNGITNLSNRTIESSIGSEGDIPGDFAIDENFLYFCIKEYDGQSPIWRRSSLKDW